MKILYISLLTVLLALATVGNLVLSLLGSYSEIPEDSRDGQLWNIGPRS